jgi:hypothetical protein
MARIYNSLPMWKEMLLTLLYDVAQKLDSKIAQLSVDGKRYEKHVQPGIQSESGA